MSPEPVFQRTHALDPERWLDEHGDALLAYAQSRLADLATAEDVVQETLLAAWRGRGSYAGQAAERTWLIGMLKRRLADHWRRQSRRRAAASNPVDSEPIFNERGEWAARPKDWSAEQRAEACATPEALAESGEFWTVLARCQEDMPPHLARVFAQRTLDDAPPENVCQSEGISRKNLSVRLHRARLLVRQCLERRWFCSD